MSEPEIRKFEDAVTKLGDAIPGHPLPVALELASEFAGRPVAEVRIAIYYSARELEARVAEEPAAPQHVRKWEPHWAILFSREEGELDGGFIFLDGMQVCVFDDGVVMASEDNEVD
ncbi:MAG: hypothetical protein NXI31_26410 [bacterium]|nr:hypothetical protein [bacterium]